MVRQWQEISMKNDILIVNPDTADFVKLADAMELKDIELKISEEAESIFR